MKDLLHHVWGLSWHHLKGPSLPGLMVDPGCQQRPQLGLPRALTLTPFNMIVVIFFTTSRFRFLIWYLRAPDMNAWRKRNRSTSFLRPGMGNWSGMTPTMLHSQASLEPRFKGQDRTQTPHLSGKSAKDFEDYILKLGHLPTIKCFQYFENILL